MPMVMVAFIVLPIAIAMEIVKTIGLPSDSKGNDNGHPWPERLNLNLYDIDIKLLNCLY